MFKNRTEAGIQLAKALSHFSSTRPIILALPRGGVPVAYEVARELNAPMDILIVKKLPAPYQPEYAIGAISETGKVFINQDAIDTTNISQAKLDQIIAQQVQEIQRRKLLYRNNHNLINIKNQTVIVIDDGLATGATAKAGILSLKHLQPKQVIFAVPVAPANSGKSFSGICTFVCLKEDADFMAVGDYYEDFHQLSDQDVLNYLEKSLTIPDLSQNSRKDDLKGAQNLYN